MDNKKQQTAKEKVLLTLVKTEAYKKVKELLPNYKLTFSQFIDEINELLIDAIENNNGHLDLQLEEPTKPIRKIKKEEEVEKSG